MNLNRHTLTFCLGIASLYGGTAYYGSIPALKASYNEVVNNTPTPNPVISRSQAERGMIAGAAGFILMGVGLAGLWRREEGEEKKRNRPGTPAP